MADNLKGVYNDHQTFTPIIRRLFFFKCTVLIIPSSLYDFANETIFDGVIVKFKLLLEINTYVKIFNQ